MRTSCLSLIIALSLFPSIGTAAEEDPFLIDKKDYRKQVKVISLAPLDLAPGLQLDAQMLQFIENEAASRLAKTKVEVIPIEPYAKIRNMMASQVGGIHDAEGGVYLQKRAIVWDHAKREMRHNHEMDAFAQISIRAVSASFADDRAEWDSVKQKVKKSGDGLSLFGGPDYGGSIAALSFQLAIVDINDNLLFVNRGGIELLQSRQGSQLVMLDTNNLLQDEKRIKKAIQIAFKPL